MTHPNLNALRFQDKRKKNLSTGEEGIIIRIQGYGDCLFQAISEMCLHLDNMPEYTKTHELLRSKVVEKMSSDDNIIKATLSAEREVSVETITDDDVIGYLKNMQKQKSWGGTPEIIAIASLLDRKIIVHEGALANQLPPGNDYKNKPILIELISENVNNYLTDEDNSKEKKSL